MDYPFFTKKLGQLSAIQIKHLQTLQELEFHQHPGFKQPVQRLKAGLDESVIEEVKAILDPILPSRMYETYELIKLCPGDFVREHSDICGDRLNRLWMASHYHKIHIPIFTNDSCVSTHRRSRHDQHSTSSMLVGEIIAYNDYVWHAGYNHGPSDRIHACLAYFDPKFECLSRL